MKIVLSDLSESSPKEKRALVQKIYEYLKSKPGNRAALAKNFLKVEGLLASSDVAILFPEFPSDTAKEIRWLVRTSAHPILLIHIGGGEENVYMQMSLSVQSASMEVKGEGDFHKIDKALRQIKKNAS